MIRLAGTRFDDIEIDERSIIHLPAGLIGFASETRFALLQLQDTPLAYLQSVDTPTITLSVVDASVFGPGYPEPPATVLAAEAGLGPDVAVLVPVAQRVGDPRLYGNLLAPIVVDVATRRAAQVVLDPERFTTETPIRRRQMPDAGRQPSVADS